jgi:hypothetical protein
MKTRGLSFWLWGIVAGIILLIAYLPTLQTIPNGSEHYYMIDVGETQIVLNVWGTLHATGYPFYVILSSALTGLLRAFGVAAATAPALTSLVWGAAAFALLYALGVRLTRAPLLVALMLVLVGLTRTVWIHFVIAEIYSFGLLLMVALLALALWQPAVPNRLYWLALLGGIGVAHHRAIAMMIPALLYAVLNDLRAEAKRKRLVLALVACLALGTLGFAQYIYLPLRANADAAWVYGEPGTWAGLWDQFSGREAERFIGAPETFEGVLANIRLITEVLITNVTLPGLIAGIVGLALGARDTVHRRVAMALLLNAGVALLFHYLFYTDILSALIIPVIVTLGFGWLMLAMAILNWAAGSPGQVQWVFLIRTYLAPLLMLVGAIAFAITLYTTHAPFIHTLTNDPTGVQTIAQVRETPPDSALMIAWGPRHFAAGFARDVEGELPNVTLVDHKADFRALAAEMLIYTPDFTFYRYPLAWWQEQVGAPVYLHAAAPGLVALATQPERGAGEALGAQSAALVCEADRLVLRVAWFTPDVPPRDLSVFVHLLDANDAVIAQGDQAAPVFGWRPLTTWTAGEIVRDVYTLPRLAESVRVRYGLYAQREDGTFVNMVEQEVAVECTG